MPLPDKNRYAAEECLFVWKAFKSSRYKEAQEGITQASAMQEQYLLQMNELNQELNDENGKLPAFQE
mgnify:CR=1 FL=1